jgi:phosphatidylserine decarboxylase
MHWLLYLLPKNILSRWWGKLAALKRPRFLSRLAVRGYAAWYGIDREDLVQPLSAYPSLADFFVRDLRPGARPLPDEANRLLCPVDGTLRSIGEIRDSWLEQIKGQRYSIDSLLGSAGSHRNFLGGVSFNLYLSPRDYHHVHSPVGGRVIRSTYIPGALWPVNDWSLARIPNLFCVNERLITWIELDGREFAVVMIGATNVGGMTVVYDNWRTNLPEAQAIEQHAYFQPMTIKAGDRLGTFHLGSSVVLLCPPGSVKLFESLENVQLPAKAFCRGALARLETDGVSV